MPPRADGQARRRNGRLPAWLRAHRTSFWLGWPALVILGWLAVLAFAHFRRGWGLYWAWDIRDAWPAILLLIGPPALIEAWIRTGQRKR